MEGKGIKSSVLQLCKSTLLNSVLTKHTQELELYSSDLLSKPALLMVNKMDSPNAEGKLETLIADLKRIDGE